jgi:RNA polymerase sigma-70 factor (ECF subfamily)
MEREASSPIIEMKDDAILVAEVQAGDENAWTSIVEQHWQQVWGLGRTIVRDQHGAEEVVLETFRVARERLAGTGPEAGLGAWLSSLCRGVALEELKRRARQPGAAPAGPQQPAADDGLERALGALDDDERQVLLLTAAGCTSDELAAALGVAPAAVRSRRARARSRLLADLGGTAR